jgi:hypothetical protein
MFLRYTLLVSVGLALVIGCWSGASAQTAPAVSNPFDILLNESANDSNFATGPIQFLGAGSISPSLFPNIYGFAQQCPVGASCPPATNLALLWRPDSIRTQVGDSTVWTGSGAGSLSGSWTLHFSTTTNFAAGTDTVLTTPALGSTGVMPFVSKILISGYGLTPTIGWVLPSTSVEPFGNPLPTINQAKVVVTDITNPVQITNIDPFATGGRTPFGQSFSQADIVYSSLPVSSSTTSVAIPATNDVTGEANFGAPVLQYGHTYGIAVELDNTNGPAIPGCGACNIASASRSFFDYTPINSASVGGAVINLPTNVTPIPTASGTVNPHVYTFNVEGVGPDSVTYIDPIVADAFIYTIGAGDPNFKSVEPVTIVGDGIYILYVWDGTKFVLVDAGFVAGSTFDFTLNGFTNGVSEFEIAGLDPGVDPTDITAFVTGLTFMSPGDFTGTMTAVITQVPEPSALLMFVSGFAMLVLLWQRQRRSASRLPLAAPVSLP